MPSRRSDKVSVESSVYAPNNQNSLTVPDKEADPLAFDKAVMALAGSPDDKPPVTTVATWTSCAVWSPPQRPKWPS